MLRRCQTLPVLLIVILLVFPRVTTAFVSPIKGQKCSTRNQSPAETVTSSTTSGPLLKSSRGQRQRRPILELQAAAKKAARGAKKKKKASAKKASAKKAATVETVRKGEFIQRLAELLRDDGFTKKDAELALGTVLEVIQDETAQGKKVTLPNFGSFVVKDRAARKGRNPQTGEEIDIPASKSPGFTPSKTWKNVLNGK